MLDFLMSVKFLGDNKIAYVFYHPVQANNLNFNSYVYILSSNQICYTIFHPYPLVALTKWSILFVKEALEQLANQGP